MIDPVSGGAKRWPVIWFDEIDSTNEEARRRAEAGQLDRHWIAARRQTSGRGRLGRKWVSPDGNLFATALLSWPYPLDRAARLPFATALAVRDTVAKIAPASSPRLKWPNDVRIDGAKISGTLIESGLAGQDRWIAVGVGLNVAFAPSVPEQDTTCIATLMSGPAPSPELVLEELAAGFAHYLDIAIESFETIRTTWLNHAEGLGQTIAVRSGEDMIKGTFDTLAPDGALILRLPDGQKTQIRAGDLQIPAGGTDAARN